MCPPLIGELVVEFASEKKLRGGAAGEEKLQKRPMLEEESMFMTLRGVIYMDVGAYNWEGLKLRSGKIGWWLEWRFPGALKGGIRGVNFQTFKKFGKMTIKRVKS